MVKLKSFLDRLELANLNTLSEKARWLVQKGGVEEKFSYNLLQQFFIDLYRNLNSTRDREVFLDQFFNRFSAMFDIEMGALFLREENKKKTEPTIVSLSSKKVVGLSSRNRILSEEQREFTFLVRSDGPVLWDKYHLNPEIHKILSKKELSGSHFFLYIPILFSEKVLGSLLLLKILNCNIYSLDQSEVKILSLLVHSISYPLYLLSLNKT